MYDYSFSFSVEVFHSAYNFYKFIAMLYVLLLYCLVEAEASAHESPIRVYNVPEEDVPDWPVILERVVAFVSS